MPRWWRFKPQAAPWSAPRPATAPPSRDVPSSGPSLSSSIPARRWWSRASTASSISRCDTAGSFTLRSSRCPYMHVRAVWAPYSRCVRTTRAMPLQRPRPFRGSTSRRSSSWDSAKEESPRQRSHPRVPSIPFEPRIVEGWTCQAGWYDYAGINAPESEPLLTLVGSKDPWFRDDWSQGSCGRFLSKSNGSRSVVYSKRTLEHPPRAPRGTRGSANSSRFHETVSVRASFAVASPDRLFEVAELEF